MLLCSLCETFTADVLRGEYSNWKRLKNDDWHAFKHGDSHTISASASAGCPLCQLFCHVREKRVPDFGKIGEKWLVQNAMIDVNFSGLKNTFQLMTELPNRSFIAFELFRPLGERHWPEDLDDTLPCEVPPRATDANALGLALTWIERCQNDHANCSRPEKTSLPTRVIDVGSRDSATSKLLVSRGQQAPYATLSHTWGEAPRLTTMKRNLKDFQSVIPTDKIPNTFQDAIWLTKAFGMRYLWIDALCIVQNDQPDWRKESAIMCAVYENAAFSISALSATDSHSGMLQPRAIDQCVMNIPSVETIGVREKLDNLQAALQASKL